MLMDLEIGFRMWCQEIHMFVFEILIKEKKNCFIDKSVILQHINISYSRSSFCFATAQPSTSFSLIQQLSRNTLSHASG